MCLLTLYNVVKENQNQQYILLILCKRNKSMYSKVIKTHLFEECAVIVLNITIAWSSKSLRVYANTVLADS